METGLDYSLSIRIDGSGYPSASIKVEGRGTYWRGMIMGVVRMAHSEIDQLPTEYSGSEREPVEVINAVISPLQFVFGMIGIIHHMPIVDRPPFALADVELIIRTMRKLQQWKEAYLVKQREVHGQHWGSALGFSTVDWTSESPAFALYYGYDMSVVGVDELFPIGR